MHVKLGRQAESMKVFSVSARERPVQVRLGSDESACCAGVFGAASGTIASADTQCWPVIKELSNAEASAEWWPRVAEHWRSLGDVQRLVQRVARENGEAPSEIWIVVGAFVCPSARTLDGWTSSLLPCEPYHPDASWPVLGFDVVDVSIQSLLHGAGEYPPTAELAQSDAFRRAQRSLNSFGLISEIDAAVQLADVASETFRNNASSLEACAVLTVPWDVD